MTSRIFIGVLAAACLAWTTQSAAYVIGGPQAVFQTSNGGYAWDGGVFVTPFRNALENPNYFGPAGVVDEVITTTDVNMAAVDPFAGLDGFIVPWWLNSEAAPYDDAVVNFFLNGGDLWVMQDSDGRDSVGDLLGVGTVGQTAITPVNGTAPLFDGPFGVANDVGQGGGEEGFLSEADVLAQNGTVVGRNTENQVIAAFWGPDQYAPGAGALIIVADIDMFTTQATFGVDVGDLDDNGRFALNAFAFLATSTDPLPSVPEPAVLGLLGVGIALIGVRRRRGERRA